MIYLTPGFRKKLADDERDYLAYADITLASGQVLNLTNTEIWQDGFQVDEAVSDDNTFGALGAAIIGAGTLIIDNTRGQYTQYDFLNADVVLSIALMIDDTNPARKETVKMGTFRVDDAQYNEATITLSLMDLMEQFDRPYTLTGIVYPATLIEIIRNACTQCSVTLATLTFPRDTYEIADPPADECTFREVISWAATLAGCFARCNKDGELEIKWFDTDALEDDTGTDGGIFDSGTPYYSTGDNVEGGSFNPWSLGDEVDGGQVTDPIPVHYIGGLYQQDICVDETVITGVRISVDNPDSSADEPTLIYTAGTSGYEVQIESNPFITPETAQTHANWLGARLIGLHFRKCNIQQVDDPAVEAGDVGLLFDSKGNAHPILITRMSFEIGGPQTIVCASDTPAHNSATRYSAATKSFVATRKLLKDQASTYEQAMEDLRDDIENKAHGLYADEIEDPDSPGSYIYCLHDKPTVQQSAVRIHVSTLGVAVTANATAQTPDWYAFRVDGTLLARVIQTMNLFFDYAHGGTLKLGGTGNGNGVLEVYDANDNLIGKNDKDGFICSKKFTVQGGNNSKLLTFDDITFLQPLYGINYIPDGFGCLVTGDTKGSYSFTTTPEVGSKYVSKHTRSDGSYIPVYNTKETDTPSAGYADTFFNRPAQETGQRDRNIYVQKIIRYKKDFVVKIGIWQSATGGAIRMPDSTYFALNDKHFYWGNDGYYPDETDFKATREFKLNSSVFLFRVSSKIWGIVRSSGIWIRGGNYSIQIDSTHTEINGNTIAFASSSSRRYKHDIKPLENEEMDPRRLLDLPAKQFVFNDDHPLQYADMAGKALPGFIAEEVAEIYPAAAIYKDGKVESWDERRIIPGMLALIQEQEKRITNQEQEIEDLKAQVKALAQAIGR